MKQPRKPPSSPSPSSPPPLPHRGPAPLAYVPNSGHKDPVRVDYVQQNRAARPPTYASKIFSFARPRTIGLVVLGTVSFGIPFYGVLLYSNLPQQSSDPSTHTVPQDVSDRYDKNARDFDSEVGTAEFLIGLNRRRKQLVKRAEGDVLEVSVGTGRNFEYYNTNKCKSLTFVDQSSPMVEVARQKWKESHPASKMTVNFITQSAIEPIPSRPPEGYDTIVQTMGLCSTPEPEKLLRNLGQMAKDDGQILLLEHGKSHYNWLNNALDNAAPAHADRYGCWWNKDIGMIVEKSGLEVVTIKRYNFGTTWWVELKPPRKLQDKSIEGNEKGGPGANVAQVNEEPPHKEGWWSGWIHGWH